MLKDIPILKVTDIGLGIAANDAQPIGDTSFWDMFLLNFKTTPIRFVVITAKSYGEHLRTGIARYYVDNVPPQSAVRVEAIQEELLNITTEYHLSFLWNDYLYDKKYIFVAGSIHQMHFRDLPFTNRRGIMIK